MTYHLTSQKFGSLFIKKRVLGLLYGPSRHRRRVYARAAIARSSDLGTRVLIFGQGRSGTTLLESLLCSTGLFVPNDEPLIGLGRSALWPTAYIIGLSRKPALQGPGGNYICHVKPDHLDRYRAQSGRAPADIEAFVHSLVRDRWHVVHVQRGDLVRQVLSSIVGKARGQWHKRDDRPEKLTVHVDREDFFERIRYNEALRVREREVLRGIPHHFVDYERDLLDPAAHEQTVDAVLSHIGLTRSGPISTDLRKINTRPLFEIVENHEEFTRWVNDLGLGDSLTPEAVLETPVLKTSPWDRGHSQSVS